MFFWIESLFDTPFLKKDLFFKSKIIKKKNSNDTRDQAFSLKLVFPQSY